MPSKNELSLKEALERYIDALKFREKFEEHKLQARWVSFVGEKLNGHTEKIELKEGKLFVKMSSSVARQELSFMRSRLIVSINKYLKKEAVKEIVVL